MIDSRLLRRFYTAWTQGVRHTNQVALVIDQVGLEAQRGRHRRGLIAKDIGKCRAMAQGVGYGKHTP